MMTSRLLGIRLKLSNVVQTNTQKISDRFGSIGLPTRLKGTIVEKWYNYWRQLVIDYKDVAVDVGKEIRTKPLKSTAIGSLLLGTYLAAERNPDETMFINLLRSYNADMMLVHDSCQNPAAAQHLKFLEQCYNEGIVRRLSIGVASFIWLDNFDKTVAIYKAMCPYLKPQYVTFHERIVDVGFWGKWWKLNEKMIDYDIHV